MRGFVGNLEHMTLENKNFRQVIFTAHYSQLVLMSVEPNQELGEEVHGLDQFIRVEKGVGLLVLEGVEYSLEDGSAILIPAGTRHNIINVSPSESLKLYTLYALPHHKDGTVHKTKHEAETQEEEFDGQVSW